MKEATVIDMEPGIDGVFYATGFSRVSKKEKKQKEKRQTMQQSNRDKMIYELNRIDSNKQAIAELLDGINTGINLFKKLRRL